MCACLCAYVYVHTVCMYLVCACIYYTWFVQCAHEFVCLCMDSCAVPCRTLAANVASAAASTLPHWSTASLMEPRYMSILALRSTR